MIGTEDSRINLWRYRGLMHVKCCYILEAGKKRVTDDARQCPETFQPSITRDDMQPHLGLRAECTHPDLCAKP